MMKMKWFVFVVAAALILFCVRDSAARATFELSGGYFYPTDRSFQEEYEGGFTIGLGLIGFIGGQEVRFGISYFPEQAVEKIEHFANMKSTFHLFPVTATWLYRLKDNERSTPYLGIGGGVYFCQQQTQWGNSKSTIDGNGAGFFGLVGFESKESPVIILEIKYRIARPKLKVMGVEGEINLDGPIVSAGVRF